ncbi:hypothetical protein Hypma_014684 [Hypsizygus marmoreus]|uniref:MYND-type domain-containing protein n=1 Tax=Hypsizygus marmoreus TaxID=39966 RepID=A0A369J9E7_HYPMA|nr:hypothetical protein Hypma_014684 [Hypsizygus marmoreus]
MSDTLTPSPLERSPCANVDPGVHHCLNEGKMACSNCQLVNYCSKTCQTTHWHKHKSDCKDPIRSKDWTPGWVREEREPTFISGSGAGPDKDWAKRLQKEEPLAIGLHLWGNIPAMDILNLRKNEGSSRRDLSLAFVASGDLRHIIRTINELPSEFDGQIDVLINDREGIVVLRNIILLLILGTISDKEKAADMALHFWYSAFLSSEYDMEVLIRVAVPFLDALEEKDGDLLSFSTELGERSRLSGAVGRNVIASLYAMVTAKPHDIQAAAEEMKRVRFAPSRTDRHDRHYCRLEPSHRLAFLEFRRFGLVLPFSTGNDHFNLLNRFLFSPQGKWMQDDLANPLESWEIPPVIKAGKSHGATRADLYGCLYFFLSDQLRTFVERLRTLRVHFRLFSQDASVLSEQIQSGKLAKYGVPSTTKFDRIHVSNIIDVEYAGIPRVLADWNPLLRDSSHATILGYFMNWPLRQKFSNPSSADEHTNSRLTDVLMKQGRLAAVQPPRQASLKDVKRSAGLMLGHMNLLTAVYENSKAYQEYLRKHGMEEALRRTKLRLKEKNTIVPMRLCAPLDGKIDALPVFPDRESWYLNACVGDWMWTERFVEFCRA